MVNNMASVGSVTSSYKPKETQAAPEGETSLLKRLGRDIFTRVVVPFLSQKSDPAPDQAALRRKFGDYSLLLESHKTNLTEKDRTDAAKQQLEQSGEVSLKEITDFENTYNQNFSSTKIRCLKIDDSDISDDALMDLLKRLPKVVDLEMQRCPNISDAALEQISYTHEDLRRFSIQENNQITDIGINFITSGCTQIKYLHFIGCQKITDLGLGFIGKNCSELLYVAISGSPKVTDLGIRSLAVGCKKLIGLIIHYLNISDDALGYIGKESPQLKNLGLDGCKEITDVGISHLGSTHLVNLRCDGTKVTFGALRELCTRCINLKTIYYDKFEWDSKVINLIQQPTMPLIL